MTRRRPRQREAIFAPAALLVGGRTLGCVGAFAIPAVLASLFVPTDFGTYTQLFLIAGTLYCVGQLGMAESLLYFVPLGLACAAMECLPSLHRSLSANRPRATVPSERARRHGV